MYIITQNWFYLALAALIGWAIACLLGFCNCNRADLEAELDGARAERDEMAQRLAARGMNDRDGALNSSLEAELDAAKARIAELEANNNGALGLASVGGATAGALAAGHVGIDKEELDALNSRNKYLEARLKFLEEGHQKAAKAPKAKAEKTPSNKDFEMSPAGKMSADELEAEVTKAGDGVKPKSVTRGADADDLLLIDGVGPKNNEWLKANGIHYFWQIATMTPAELAWLANNLPNFGSRVYRENWVSQCANLAKGMPPRQFLAL